MIVGIRSYSASVRRAYWPVLMGTFVLLAGCDAAGGPIVPTSPRARAIVPRPGGPSEPAEVELSDHRVRVDDSGVFYFDVKYRFNRGAPRQFYMLTVKFPGTNNLCIKRMEAWELTDAGQIRDGIPLYEQPIQDYEISFSESDSPMNEYRLISNVLTGTWSPARRAAD
ncbi:MAG: hypothetical protein AB7F89_17690 [Pirellulaceae bacterium]